MCTWSLNQVHCPHSAFPDLLRPVFVFPDESACEPALEELWSWSLPVANAACCSLSCRRSLISEASLVRLARIWSSVAFTAARTNADTPLHRTTTLVRLWKMLSCSISLYESDLFVQLLVLRNINRSQSNSWAGSEHLQLLLLLKQLGGELGLMSLMLPLMQICALQHEQQSKKKQRLRGHHSNPTNVQEVPGYFSQSIE